MPTAGAGIALAQAGRMVRTLRARRAGRPGCRM